MAHQRVPLGREHHDLVAPDVVLDPVRPAAEEHPRRLELNGPAADKLQQPALRGGLPLAFERVLLARTEHKR